jgi:4-hydroxybenzoate polyprenyltransferase
VLLGLVRLVHPAPAAAVIALSAGLAAILARASSDGGYPLDRVLLVVVAVAGSQILTGALNDWTDRDRDALAQPSKPIPSGHVRPAAALALAAAGGVVQVVASVPLGWAVLGLGAAASASAVAYNLWLSRTPFSVLPYLVSFGILPVWVAAGVAAPFERVALAPILVGPFAAAAHLANALRDFDADARLGSRNLAQVLGRRAALALAGGLALSVGVVAGVVLMLGPQASWPLALIGAVGLVAVVGGLGSPLRLWYGLLGAAVAWTIAWALAIGSIA